MNDKQQSTSSSQGTKDAVAKVHDVAEQARSAAVERVDFVRDQADSAKTKAAERVRKLGQAVRKIGEHMRIEDQIYIAEHANSASQRLDSVATYIDDAEVGTLVRDAERLARSNPAWVLGGTFLVGLAAGRILKVPAAGVSAELNADRALPQSTVAVSEPLSVSGPAATQRSNESRSSEPRGARSPGLSGKTPKDAEAQR